MPIITSAIVFVNNDLTQNVQDALVRQLFIDEVMDGYEFDLRVSKDPNYPTIVHNNNLKILVVRSFYELTNRDLCDVAIFVKAGLAAIEQNKLGPHRGTHRVEKLTLYKLFKK